MDFLWQVLIGLQVLFGLRDHFATKNAYLWHRCTLFVGEILADGILRNYFITTASSIGGTWVKFLFHVLSFALSFFNVPL